MAYDDSTAVGVIIYKAFSPTLKIALCIVLGYVFTKRGLFTPQSAKGVSIISLNISLPCLVFSSMVSAFTSENIAAFGPLAMMAIMYQTLGLLICYIIREVFWVPVDFRWGILVSGCISNWGNVPTAVVQQMANAAPFDPDTDVDLGVAYIAVFILIMNTTFFGLGVHKVCAWDFREDHMVADPLPFRQRWAVRLARARALLGHKMDVADDLEGAGCASGLSGSLAGETPGASDIEEKRDSLVGSLGPVGIARAPSRLGGRYQGGAVPQRMVSRAQSINEMMETTRPIPPTAPLDALGYAAAESSGSTLRPTISYAEPLPPAPPAQRPLVKRFPAAVWRTVIGLPPTTWATFLGIPISVVSPLKALFTPVDGWSGTRIPYAPDGNPPLYFLLETATFMGQISIPAALVLLGASFARLKMPNSWRELPLAAIVSVAVAKMVIVPIFGIFVVQAFRGHTSLFPAADKIRVFVTVLLSGTPAAVNQLVVTQLYNPAGSAHTLACFLLLQYIVMFVLSTALAAIALWLVE
ncbi:Protein M3 [Cryptotrichosporon argae]